MGVKQTHGERLLVFVLCVGLLQSLRITTFVESDTRSGPCCVIESSSSLTQTLSELVTQEL